MALVGLPNSGKSTIFHAVASTVVQTGRLAGTHKPYAECPVQIGADEIHLVDLPGFQSLRDLQGDDLEALKYLLWGDARPLVSDHEQPQPPAPFSRPDLLIYVLDASALQQGLELALELPELGLPVVIALNMMDEAARKGVQIDVDALAQKLGCAVIPTVAQKGRGLDALFAQTLARGRDPVCPLPQPISPHLQPWAQRMHNKIDRDDLRTAFNVPSNLLTMNLMERDTYFLNEVASHFPELSEPIRALHDEANAALPRPLVDEVHADRHHRAVELFESIITRVHQPKRSFEDLMDTLFLHPRWGLLGSLAVFAAVLFVVFEVSVWLDAASATRLSALVADWHPNTLGGVIMLAITNGLIGLIGIVVPYMLPLVLMLVALEESGIMHRIAFVMDRFFHAIGLHGKVAVPFLLGLGCNVPAIAATRALPAGRERVIASLLITFVPCSARSAIVLALGEKYLGGLGVFLLFMLSIVVIAILGRLLSRHYPEISPGLIQEIPPYRWPALRDVLRATWQRTQDIITIVTPLLVIGSIVLAILQFYGADQLINQLLSPLTVGALGLPAVLGVPILFGVLRKELSLIMIYQAVGTFELEQLMTTTQITTFLVFLLFYIPCISTFAVMLRIIGRKEALFSIALSIGVATLVAIIVRLLMTTAMLVG